MAVAALLAVWTLTPLVSALGWDAWERAVLGAPFLTAGVGFFVVPLVLGTLTGSGVDLHHRQPGRWLEIGCMALGVIGPLGGIAIALAGDGLMQFPMAVVVATAYLLTLPIMVVFLRRTKTVDTESPPLTQLLLGLGLAAVTLVVAALLGSDLDLGRKSLYLLVFVGVGEEILFRGLLQGALDEVLGRPWKIGGAQVGWGWIIQAVLFGITHPLLAGDASLWGWGLWTAAAGLAFGWLRARSGTILAPGLVHGVIDVIGLVVVPALA